MWDFDMEDANDADAGHLGIIFIFYFLILYEF